LLDEIDHVLDIAVLTASPIDLDWTGEPSGRVAHRNADSPVAHVEAQEAEGVTALCANYQIRFLPFV
jgi:hypothetical protein